MLRHQILGVVAGLSGVASAAAAQSPAFQKYPVSKVYAGPQARARVARNSPAWKFRTRIREAAQQRPNFAGHYVFTAWGCGSECLRYAIVDVLTGAVYFDNVALTWWGATTPEPFTPLNFRVTSSLVVFTGVLGAESKNTTYYFRFSQGRLLAVQ